MSTIINNPINSIKNPINGGTANKNNFSLSKGVLIAAISDIKNPMIIGDPERHSKKYLPTNKSGAGFSRTALYILMPINLIPRVAW